MLKTVDFYFFSPTGGTKKAGSILAYKLAEAVNENDLAEKTVNEPLSDVVVVAAPVFAGRIPAPVAEKIAKINGAGKKAITAVVYGVRAYDDALLELNDVMKAVGFEVIASAALIAQHSMVPEVGAGRPDEADAAEIRLFAERVLNAIESGSTGDIEVPGNHPYRDGMTVSATPLSLDACTGCGYCSKVCPTDAITVVDGNAATELGKCMLCLSCVAKCPAKVRILPPPMQAGLAERLGVFKDVRRENEFFV